MDDAAFTIATQALISDTEFAALFAPPPGAAAAGSMSIGNSNGLFCWGWVTGSREHSVVLTSHR
jgi:hypothetical protein